MLAGNSLHQLLGAKSTLLSFHPKVKLQSQDSILRTFQQMYPESVSVFVYIDIMYDDNLTLVNITICSKPDSILLGLPVIIKFQIDILFCIQRQIQYSVLHEYGFLSPKIYHFNANDMFCIEKPQELLRLCWVNTFLVQLDMWQS